MTALPERRAARLLVVDARARLLLFRFTPDDRPPFWATPGGELEGDEDFADAARRELEEETGFVAEPGEPVDFKTSEFKTFSGRHVRAVEQYFVVRVEQTAIDTSGHSRMERDVMREHRWWSAAELRACADRYYPPDLPDLHAQAVEETP